MGGGLLRSATAANSGRQGEILAKPMDVSALPFHGELGAERARGAGHPVADAGDDQRVVVPIAEVFGEERRAPAAGLVAEAAATTARADWAKAGSSDSS